MGTWSIFALTGKSVNRVRSFGDTFLAWPAALGLKKRFATRDAIGDRRRQAMADIAWPASFALIVMVPVAASPALGADTAVQLRENFAAGYQYHVSTRTELAGILSLPRDKNKPASQSLPVTGNSAIEYDERVLSVDKAGQTQKTARIFRRVEFQRKVGDRTQTSTVRPDVRRLVILRHNQAEVPFSPDGPLNWGEIDLVRTDVFTPALSGLLPAQAVLPGARWFATSTAVQELTDLERIEEGKVECRLDQIAILEKRRHARVGFSGTVRGVNEDGPNRQQLEGYFYFDLESNHLSYLFLKGVSFLLDMDGRTLGRVEGQFVLTRQAPTSSKELSDEALKGWTLEPTEENTQLLYDNPDLGVRILHSRRWHIAGVRGRQVALDESKGSGVLITLEPPGQAPTGAQFHVEVAAWLQQQKAKVFRLDPVQRVAGADGLEHFIADVELAGQHVVLDYYVSRQSNGGATMAARLLTADLDTLQPQLDRIARSVQITRPLTAEPKKSN
jgi:hypothetical protein